MPNAQFTHVLCVEGGIDGALNADQKILWNLKDWGFMSFTVPANRRRLTLHISL